MAMKRQLHALMVDSSDLDVQHLLDEISRGGYETFPMRVDTPQAMQAQLEKNQWDIVIAEYSLPKFSGLAALQLTRHYDLDLPFIIASDKINEDTAVEAMRSGANDYITKSNPSRLIPVIERELRKTAARRGAQQDRRKIDEAPAQLRGIVANIPGVVFQLLRDCEDHYTVSYVSEGSNRLLELTPQALQNDVAQLFNLMLDGGNAELQGLVAQSAENMKPVSWEGRIRAVSDGLVKWIEVRMMPRRLTDGRIQWDGIINNVSQRKFAEIELMESRQRLSELSSHLQHAKEVERTRIAREVHDEIGGNLTAIKIDLLWIISRLDKNRADLVEKAHSLATLIDRTLEISSRIAHDLRPPLLDFGLAAAIEWEASEFQKRMEIPCVVSCKGDDSALGPELATALFSIFRETLTNISKHAKATKVEIELYIDASAVKLKVRDHGLGILNSDLHKHGSFGLRGMLERARHLGGEIDVEGTPHLGTIVTVTIPLESSAPLQLNMQPQAST